MTENKEMVSHPDHYNKGESTYEPYKVIAKWNCNFNIGSAIKYLARYKNKWNPIEDLKKAKQYIDFEIEELETEGGIRKPKDETTACVEKTNNSCKQEPCSCDECYDFDTQNCSKCLNYDDSDYEYEDDDDDDKY